MLSRIRCLPYLLLVLQSVLLGSVLVAGAQTRTPTGVPPSLPLAPWQRLLSGAEARQADELEKEIGELRRAGKFAEARVPAQRLWDLRRQRQGGEHWQTGDAERLLQLVEKTARLPPSARAELARADRQTLEGQQLHRRGQFGGAESLLRAALESRRRFLGEEHLETVNLLPILGECLDGQAKYAEAQPLMRKALAVRIKVLGDNHPDTAGSYDTVAANLDLQGKHAEAEPFFRKALEISVTVLGDNHPDTGASYHNAAFNLNQQRKYPQAERLCRKALAICLKLSGDGLDTANCYNTLGFCLAGQGKFSEAERLSRITLEIRRKVLGEEHPATANGCNSVAANLDSQGKYVEAVSLYLRALEIRRKALGEDHLETAISYSNVGLCLAAQGKYSEAEPLSRRALEIRRRLLGEIHPYTAQSYNNVAGNLREQGRFAEADPLFRKALNIRRQTLGENHPDTAESYSNVAGNLDSQGKHSKAEPLHRMALEIRSMALGENHPVTAGSSNNLAVNLDAQGKYVEAEALCRKGLESVRRAFGENHTRTARVYNNTATILYSQGKYAQAEAYFTLAAGCSDGARLRAAAAGLERASFAARFFTWRDSAACRARLSQPVQAWHSLESGLARGLLDELSTRLAPELTPDETKHQQALTAQLADLERQTVVVLQAKQQTDEIQKRFEELCRARQQGDEEIARLATAVASRQVYDFRRIQAQLSADAAWIAWVDLKAQRKAVDPNGEHWACVFRRQGDPVWVRLPGSGLKGAWTEDDDDLLDRFRLAISGPPGRFREELEALTHQVFAQRLAPLEPALRATGGLPAVKRLLVCPVWWLAGVPIEALTDEYTISYVPSGTLFARLQEQRRAKGPAGEGATLFALGDPVFRERPTDKEEPQPDAGVLITALLPRGNADRSGLKPDDVLLAYGDKKLSGPADLRPTAPEGANEVPVQVWRQGQTLERKLRPGKLDVMIAKQPAPVALREKRQAASALRASEGPYYPRLPGTRQEVQAIAGLFDQPLVLLDAAASAQRLDALAKNDELRRFRYLHFATHGELNHRMALQSALILASAPQPATTESKKPGLFVNPRWSDGRLTAARMLEWKLDAELVTLSACQSGLGKQASGEGFLGFAQALFLAGARSVVLSLWKVDDTATALLMTRFYQNLLGKRDGLKQPLPKAEALAEAKRWLRGLTKAEAAQIKAALPQHAGAGQSQAESEPGDPEEHPYSHPFYWSAFILIGDPN